MNRRGFLSGILATACAPAIVRADSLMRIIPRDTSVISYAVFNDVQLSQYGGRDFTIEIWMRIPGALTIGDRILLPDDWRSHALKRMSDTTLMLLPKSGDGAA